MATANDADIVRLQRAWSLLLIHLDEQEAELLADWVGLANEQAAKRLVFAQKIHQETGGGNGGVGARKRADASGAALLRTLATLGVVAANNEIKGGG
jgi:hypothetical protein